MGSTQNKQMIFFQQLMRQTECFMLLSAFLDGPFKGCSSLWVQVAQKLGLQCLVEVHTIAELERIIQLGVLLQNCMLGINNRDLQTFKVDLGNNKVIMESKAGQLALQRGLIFAGESGIYTPGDVKYVTVNFTHFFYLQQMPPSASLKRDALPTI